MKYAFCILILLVGISSCSVLGEVYSYIDPQTGEQVTTTVGEAVADQIDGAGAVVGDVVGKAVGVATGNPIVGVGAAALLATLLGAGTSRLRRKKKTAADEAA